MAKGDIGQMILRLIQSEAEKSLVLIGFCLIMLKKGEQFL